MKRTGKMFFRDGRLRVRAREYCGAATSGHNDARQATIWTMSNDPAGNAVLAFGLADGRLTMLGCGSQRAEPDREAGNRTSDWATLTQSRLRSRGEIMFVVNTAGRRTTSLCLRLTTTA